MADPLVFFRTRFKTIEHTFAGANADETIISKPSDGKLSIIKIIADVASGLTSPTVTIKDGTKVIGTFALTVGDAESIIDGHGFALEIDGDLVAQVSSTSITLSAWAR